jgi:DNA gyrase subunit B
MAALDQRAPYSDSELRTVLLELQREGQRWKEPVQRYKGLGEMDALDPRQRTLRRINVGDLDAAEKVFDLLMGNDVAPRKQFIVDSAALLDRSRIDA